VSWKSPSTCTRDRNPFTLFTIYSGAYMSGPNGNPSICTHSVM
jgi:hypothetical protein